MSSELDTLRKEIDNCDSELLDILAKRYKAVEKIGQIKQTLGLPIYSPDREKKMFKSLKQMAIQKKISPDLIEDIIKRIMQDSYSKENNHSFNCLNDNNKYIIIVGGNGNLGALFLKLFKSSKYRVVSVDKQDWASSSDYFKNAALVIVSVPISLTKSVINKIPVLPKDCILADFTSLKKEPLAAMLAHHPGPVVGLHPMFGPDIKNLAKQLIICCNGRQKESYRWFLDQLTIWGANIVDISADEHDHYMKYIQVLRHFTSFIYGNFLRDQDVNLEKLIDLSSPIYNLELTMVGRLFAQDPALYKDIVFSSEQSLEIIDEFLKYFSLNFSQLKKEKGEHFKDEFKETSEWFGDFSSKFMKESKRLLVQGNQK